MGKVQMKITRRETVMSGQETRQEYPVMITDVAKQKVMEYIERYGREYHLRIIAKSIGGPRGEVQLDLGLDKEVDEKDMVFDIAEFKVLIDPASFPLVKGRVIDFDEGSKQFVVRSTRSSPKKETSSTPVKEIPKDKASLRKAIEEMLQTIYDPEIPVDIWNLGLVYRIDIKEDGLVEIDFTLTAPGCPVGGYLVNEVKQKVESVPGVKECKVTLVWNPPWTPERMTPAAKAALGIPD